MIDPVMVGGGVGVLGTILTLMGWQRKSVRDLRRRVDNSVNINACILAHEKVEKAHEKVSDKVDEVNTTVQVIKAIVERIEKNGGSG